MRWFKLGTTALVVGLIALFINQNLSTFRNPIPFSLNLYITQKIEWSHHLYTLLILTAALGFFVGVVVAMRPYLHVRRQLAVERQEKKQPATPQESKPGTGGRAEASHSAT